MVLNLEHKSNPAITADQDVNYVQVSTLIRNFPHLAKFAKCCHLPIRASVAEDPSNVLRRIESLNFSAKLHLLHMSELHLSWGLKADCHFHTAPGQMKGKWDVAVELMGPKRQLVVGWLLAAYGYVVEDIASNKGYVKGRLDLRGTSFDAAVALIGHATKFPTDQDVLRQVANSLVALINGCWIGMAAGLHERHSCVDLLLRCAVASNKDNNLLAVTVEKHAKALARAMSVPDFYHQFIHCDDGWESEKHMCLAMDLATKQLLQDLR